MLSINPSLYAHIPFCRKRCHYCDFYSCSLKDFPGSVPDLFAKYTDKLVQQYEILRKEFSLTGFSTVYIGGGTPSLVPTSELNRFLSHLELTGCREITIEVNPESICSDLLSSYKKMGINRISMGLQSLRPDILAKMGRLASREKNLESVKLLASRFENWSIDFIFAFPGQSKESQLRDLEELLALGPPHFSLYFLTVEEGTVLSGKLNDGAWTLPEDEHMAEAWEEGLSLIEKAGYERYEISSFCRKERYSRHNLAYWNTGRWIGLGAGATSMLTEDCRFTGKGLDAYLAAGSKDLKSRGPFYEREMRTDADKISEGIMMGLRTAWGVSSDRLSAWLPGEDLSTVFSRSLEKWKGRLILDAGGLRLNSRGLDWHSAVMVDLLLDLDKFFDYNSSL